MAGVDYEQAETVRRYARGRSLGVDVLNRWQVAVAPHLPDRAHLRVLDLGAGTGIFARVWPQWVPCSVVAVEPSAAMRTAMIDNGRTAAFTVIGAQAERLPLRPASIDAVWLSAVIHHFNDLDRSAEESAGVLAGEGVVLIRGLFSDLGTTPALEFFPGADRAVARFPAVGRVEQAFRRSGFQVVSVETVEDAGPSTMGEVANRVRGLRTADTLLQQFTDDEIASGLATIEALDQMQPVPPAQLGLITLRR